MKLLVLNNLASGYGEGAIYDFVRSFAADGDEVCLRSTDGTTELESLITDARDFDAVIAATERSRPPRIPLPAQEFPSCPFPQAPQIFSR